MSKVLKIVSIAVVVFLAYMWVSLLTKSCNKENEIQFPKEQVQNTDEFGQDFFEEEKSTTPTSNTDTVVDYKQIDSRVQETIEAPAEKTEKPSTVAVPPTIPAAKQIVKPTPTTAEPLPSATKPAPSPKEKIVKEVSAPVEPQKQESKPSSSGQIFVVAGNYLLESNADVMVKKLKKNGFNSAEKVVFDASEFHTVIAGRFNNTESAKATVSRLKAKGIEAYTRVKK
jgi:cell division septation protein DedD